MVTEYSPRWARKHRSELDTLFDDEEDRVLVWWSALRVAVLNAPGDGTRWDHFNEALKAYRRWRLALGQDGLAEAWAAAKAGHPLLWPLAKYSAAYNARYRGSPAQKRHQAKYHAQPEVKARRAKLAKVHGPRYQSKPEVKARRAELARARRALRKEAESC